MKCQKCGEREANTHLTKIINGQKWEYHLCEQCAKENEEFMNFKSNFDPSFDIDFNNFLGGMFGGFEPNTIGGIGKNTALEATCDKCGMTLGEFSKTGKLGCPNCYNVFRDRLIRPLKQIHGNVQHMGKIPLRTGGEIELKHRIKNLELELNEAVMKQQFERAAEIRDEIRALKGEGK